MEPQENGDEGTPAEKPADKGEQDPQEVLPPSDGDTGTESKPFKVNIGTLLGAAAVAGIGSWEIAENLHGFLCTFFHWLSLSSVACAVIALAEKSVKNKTWIVLTSIASCIVLAPISWIVWPPVPPAPDNLLLPGNQPTPDEAKAFVNNGDSVLLLGKTVLFAESLPHDFIVKDGEAMLSIGARKTGFWFMSRTECWLSAKMFKQDGTIIAELLQNEFVTNSDNVFRIERTPHVITIYDKTDTPVVSLEALNKSVFRFTGSFCIRGGIVISVTKDAVDIGPGLIHSTGGAIGQMDLSGINLN